MKNNFLTPHHITFINIFFDNILNEIHIHNYIKKIVKVLLI